jgi:hypothetical protein
VVALRLHAMLFLTADKVSYALQFANGV